MNKKLLFVGLSLALSSFLTFQCSKKNSYKEIEGFWVSIDFKTNRPFQTLTIYDSLVEKNKYGINNATHPIFAKEGYFEAVYPFDSWETAFQLFPKEDTLLQIFANGGIDTIRYVRMDSLKVYKEIVLSDALPLINLPEPTEKASFVSIEKRSLVSNFFVGPLKSGIIQDFPTIATDSVVLQVVDVLISLSEISEFLKMEQSMIDESERERLMVVLYADDATTKELIDNVKQTIYEYDPDLAVYRAYIDWTTRSFLYKRI